MATSFAWSRWAPWSLWATSTPQDFARWVTRCGIRTIIESLIARRYRSMPTTGSKRPESKPLLHPPMCLTWSRSKFPFLSCSISKDVTPLQWPGGIPEPPGCGDQTWTSPVADHFPKAWFTRMTGNIIFERREGNKKDEELNLRPL